MRKFIKINRIDLVILLLILIVGAALRLYQIDGYMTFLGDEGRDALVIKKMLTTGDIPLIGPPTSVGSMYLGPLYYYMMALPMAIFWLNPLAAAVQVALIGVASIGLIYYLSKVWFGRMAAIIASILYTLSPINIIYSRSSWNPNPAPFFALLLIISLYKSHQTKNYLWFILTGVSLAFAVQMHYLALILLPIAVVLWVWEFFKKRAAKSKHFWIGTFLGVVLFLTLMSPLLIFDLRHNFMNYRAMTTFFTNRETTVNLNLLNTLNRYPTVYSGNLIGEYITGDNQILKNVVSIILLIPLALTIYLWRKGKKILWGFVALYSWLIIGVSGLVLYKQTIYAHYLGFLNPAPFIILGSLVAVTSLLPKTAKKVYLLMLIIFAVSLVWVEAARTPLNINPNNQLKRTQNIAKYVIEQSGNKPFNFALISEHNYDAAYQFYLDVYKHKPKQLPFEKTDQIFVVCEDKECKPVGHPKYEIAAFGWTQIESEAPVEGVRVFKLIPYQGDDKVSD